jgi:hypothetical protein
MRECVYVSVRFYPYLRVQKLCTLIHMYIYTFFFPHKDICYLNIPDIMTIFLSQYSGRLDIQIYIYILLYPLVISRSYMLYLLVIQDVRAQQTLFSIYDFIAFKKEFFFLSRRQKSNNTQWQDMLHHSLPSAQRTLGLLSYPVPDASPAEDMATLRSSGVLELL